MNKKIVVGADPIGKPLKDAICQFLRDKGYEITDVGSDEMHDVDYYIVGDKIGKLISSNQFERGLIFCGSGMGVNIVANKHAGVYCGLCESVMTAKLCRIINNCNVLSLGALTTTVYKAEEMVMTFLETEFAKNFTLAEPEFLKQAVEEIRELEKELFHECSTL